MSFFRSEPMSLCHLIVHQEYAFDCIVELGYEAKVQFLKVSDEDRNDKFVNEIKRCEELLQTMKTLQDEINSCNLHTVFYSDADEEKPKERDLLAIETVIKALYTEFSDVQTHCEALQRRRLTLYEHRQVLERVNQFLTGAQNTEAQISGSDSIMERLIKDFDAEESGNETIESGSLIIVSGSIPVARFAAFELMVWRLTRGNAFIKHAMFELPDELANRFKYRLKHAFMLAFFGEGLHQKILKMCQGFEIRIYACANTSLKRQRVLQELFIEFEQLKLVLEKTCEHKKRILAVACGDLFLWRAKIKKMLHVYHLINGFSIVHELRRQYFKYLRVDCWVPRSDLQVVRAAVGRVSTGDSSTFPPLFVERPYHLYNFRQPTYFRTNKFTRGFQNLIDGYGISTYRELNPAPYTIITFPFLFAVMFGDVGHGILMSLFAIALICREKKIENNRKESLGSSEIFDLLFAGRYIILLMGLFSVYTGFIYNDVLSKSTNIFGSRWRANFTRDELVHYKEFKLDPANKWHYLGTPYIFGIDPAWNAMTENAIIFNNSLKMKVAIILGVVQMIFGLTLSGWNALFFRSKADFYLVFLPQLTFLMSLFFYLVVLIFHKWSFYGGHEKGGHSALCAPSILITFINMVLIKKSDEPPKGCSPTMFAGQIVLERILLFLAVIAVPILLCGKPLHFMYESRRLKRITDPDEYEEIRRSTINSLRRSLVYSIELTEQDSHAKSINPEESLSEVWIHQAIHTIECVLGSVSHTASYLRLWALSLAHAQLSHVLWKMVLSSGLVSKRGYFNAIVIFFTFGGFAALTVAILVVMEGLSAFLHTLRLHWVEFQSKFYGGLGEAFTPFRFQESRKKDSYA